MRRQLAGPAGIVLLAVIARWTYAIVCYAALGDGGLMSGDSYGYLSNAKDVAEYVAAGGGPTWKWLGPDLQVMPMFIWLVAANVFIAGQWAVLASILVQGLLDTATCLGIYGIARSIAPQYALAAGFAAALNPTQIVLSGLLYNDTLFVLFATLSLLGTLRFLEAPNWRRAVWTGCALGAAAMTRMLIVLWVPCLMVFVLATLAITRRLQWRHVPQLAVAGILMAAFVLPVLARNVSQYGAWALTPQGGAHLVSWVLPLIKESQDGTPWTEGSKIMEAEMRQRFPVASENPFVEAQHYAAFGREKLWEFGPRAIAKAWFTGAALNIGAPAALVSPLASKLPRTGFYDIKAGSTLEKIWTYLFRSDNALYAWIVLIGISGVAMFRLVELAGVPALLRQPHSLTPLILLGGWIGFILLINGPIASPKYRLPLEPVFALLTGAGAAALRNRTGDRRT